MKLYHFPTSPFVRKVMVLLHETGQLDDVEIVETTVTPLTENPDFFAKNPLGKIPALEREEGATLYDSRVICAYLCDRAGKGMPEGAAKWETLTLEATADGIMEAAVLMTYETRIRPEDKRFPDWVEGQWGKIDRAAGTLNARWMGHLQGPLTLGQVAVACALAYVDFRHPSRDWRSGRDALAGWFEAFSERPSMKATVPPG